jgi:hypothetical protein
MPSGALPRTSRPWTNATLMMAAGAALSAVVFAGLLLRFRR